MHTVKFRAYDKRLRPRRIKMAVPGWAGAAQPRTTGSHEQPWHCTPFTEAATYGVEIAYPYDHEVRVSVHDGAIRFEGEFGEPPSGRQSWPPFRSFGEKYYTFQLSADFMPPDGFATRIDPHPRFFTDFAETTPIAVPAMIRTWWPMINFLVFKTPTEGRTHIFRGGEGMVQLTFVPEKPNFTIDEMSHDEAADRELRSRRIYDSRSTIGADSQWLSATDTVFDATYRRLHESLRDDRS